MSEYGEQILSFLTSYDETASDILAHYGTKRHSGRYPWGSGENPFQHEIDFLDRVRKYRAKGMTEKEIAKKVGYSTTSELRAAVKSANNDINQARIHWANQLLKDGLSQSEAARRMGIPVSTFRSIIDKQRQARVSQAQSTADFLKKVVKEKGPVDVGSSVEKELRISKEKLNQAIDILKEEGYEVRGGRMPQVTNESGQMTTLKVLCPPGSPKNMAYQYDQIHSLFDYSSEDGGQTFNKFEYPESMDSKRILFRYAEDGGDKKDGLIEIRPGVDDLYLGGSRYSQVRVLVDGNKYIKGMAAYSDDIPDGYDMIVNSHYSKASGKALKDIKTEDPMNPFGSYISAAGQSHYIGKDGKEHLSLINKRADEGDWDEWSRSLPSQFLSKQNKKLVEQQLELSIADEIAEYEEICSLTNPTVKRRLLETFAEDCDSRAVHLDAAALPRQRYQVIIPVSSLKNDQVYAPNFKDGEKVALVRYPHAGIFEIPVLTVNNKNREGISLLSKNPTDAIGINSEVAKQLSGADFDGDTVMVIPLSSKVNISHRPYLKELLNDDGTPFDPQMSYPYREGMKVMTRTDIEMGVITNLIMDMTLAGAHDDEVARAVKHSMVVIDAKKHKLDYQLSEKENGIAELKDKYQGHYNEDGRWVHGSGTIVTRAKSETRVNKRRGDFKVDPETGKKIWKDAYDLEYVDSKTGKTKTRTQSSYKMLETDDPYSLVSDTSSSTEMAYARYAAQLKALANEARKEYAYNTPNLEYSPSAKKTYAAEVESLTEKLRRSRLNAPREREAQRRANVRKKQLLQEHPELKEDKKTLGKYAQQYLTAARNEVGATRYKIDITPKEWEAIQAGAISDSFLKQILDATDTNTVRAYATPKQDIGLSSAKQTRLFALKRSGYSNQEIADALNVPLSTVKYYIREGKS